MPAVDLYKGVCRTVVYITGRMTDTEKLSIIYSENFGTWKCNSTDFDLAVVAQLAEHKKINPVRDLNSKIS
jgi:hypothetical protein